MFRKTHHILFILLFIACENIAQSSFQKTYGTSLNENGFSVQQTNDGGFIACGMHYKDTADVDIYLLKTNAQGDTSWIKYYGGTAADFGEYVGQTNDGGFIIAGITSSYGAGSSDVYLIKTNSNGDTLWTRTYGGNDSELGHAVKQTTDGGYIIAGHSDTFGTQGDFYIIKINANGDTSWTRAYGGALHDHAFSIVQTADNGYLAVGHSLSFGTLGGFYAVKTNATGDTMWTRGYGGSGNSFCYAVERTADGGYILGGQTECFGAGMSDCLAIKLNSAGDTVWCKTYGGPGSDFLNGLKPLPDGGYILAGYTDSYGAGSTDALLIKINAAGNVVWSKTYGGSLDDEADAVNLASDGGFVMTGSTKSFGAGAYDVYLLKTDSLGNPGCQQGNISLSAAGAAVTVFNVASHGSPAASTVSTTQTMLAPATNSCAVICSANGLEEKTKNSTLRIYPNPAAEFVVLESEEQLANIYLADMLGNCMYRVVTKSKNYTLDLRSLSDGIYLLRVNEHTTKIIKESR